MTPHRTPWTRSGLRPISILAALACGIVGFSAGAATAVEADGAPQSFDEAAAMQPVEEPSDDRVIGRVTGVHGRVYAEAPDGTRRPLVENGPIYPGDRLITNRGAQLGVLTGDHYTGLNEDTELSFALTPGGAPEVQLVRGHVRVIEAGDEGAPAKLTTPALQIAAASGDTEVYAFPEKAYLVSMVCALEGQVLAANTAGQSATVGEGGCAIAKPLEGIYAAGAAAAPLPPVGAAGAGGAAGAPRAGDGGPPPPAGSPAQRFASPADVAGGPSLLAARAAPDFGYSNGFGSPCDVGAIGACGSQGGGASGGSNPPSNPSTPGLPPPGFPTNPPSNPSAPGLPPPGFPVVP